MMGKVILLVSLAACGTLSLAGADPFKTVTFKAQDGVTVTADLYVAHPASAPFVVLFHQAESSRGEYRTIAPRLNELGFNAMAVDQRSGASLAGVPNATNAAARAQGKSTTYLDALPDMEAAIAYAKSTAGKGKLLVWGSSYSASLVLKIAGDSPGLVDGVLAFSPGEYFQDLGKSRNFIKMSAREINVPVFISSQSIEESMWRPIYEAIPSPAKAFFLPKTESVHGSSALLPESPASEATWKAVSVFLRQFGNRSRP